MAGDEGANWRDAGWLHLCPQPFEHADAEIRGTPQALRALRAALDAALEGGSGEAVAFAADGEGYAIRVARVEGPDGLGPLPYSDDHWVEARRAAREAGGQAASASGSPAIEAPGLPSR